MHDKLHETITRTKQEQGLKLQRITMQGDSTTLSH